MSERAGSAYRRWVIVCSNIAMILCLAGILFRGFAWVHERVYFISLTTGDIGTADRGYFKWEIIHPMDAYRIVSTKPSILSAAFDEGVHPSDRFVYPRHLSQPTTGVTDEGYLILESDWHDGFGLYLQHATYMSMVYSSRLPTSISSLEEATPAGLAFQRFLLRKKQEDPSFIPRLKDSMKTTALLPFNTAAAEFTKEWNKVNQASADSSDKPLTGGK